MIVKNLANSFNPVPKQPKKEEKKKTEIKKKSSKLEKLERKRDKGIEKCGICNYCHNYNKRLDPHEVYGGSNRGRSIKNGFVKMLCRNCHSDEEILLELKKNVQEEYEKNHSREDFIKLIGKSYL